jgi:Zn-dependent protease
MLLSRTVSDMHTLHGIRFLPVARIDGTLLGLDARWLGVRGVMLMVVFALVTPSGALGEAGPVPLWLKLGLGLSSMVAVALTSLGHELGHALAGRLAGLKVRAIVLRPEGGVTIRSTSDQPQVNFRTALAGPLANALFASLCALLAIWAVPDSFAAGYLNQVGMLQLFTAVANLLPLGPMDGSHILAAWRACRSLA